MSEALKPQAGDMVWADRSVNGLPYFHCGIYSGGGKVIHFAAPEGAEISAENAVVHETDYENFAAGCPVKIIDCPNAPYSSEETVRRARSRIGERGYDLATNNCEHFAAWCKTGQHTSTQVNELKDVIKIIGGQVGEIICGIHDIAQDYTTGKLQDARPAAGVFDNLDITTEFEGVMPSPEPVEIDKAGAENLPALIGDFEVQDEAPDDGSGLTVDAVPYDEDDEDDEAPDEGPPRKKLAIDTVADGLKGVTFAVAGALECLKPRLPGPLKVIPFRAVALKVASTIDKTVVHIKRFFGRLTAEQAHEELQNIDAAVLGETVAQKQTPGLPVKEAVKAVFGKAGAGIARIASKVIATIASPKLRNVIKTGARKVAGFISRGLRVFASAPVKMLSGIKSVGKAIAGFFGFGRG